MNSIHKSENLIWKTKLKINSWDQLMTSLKLADQLVLEVL